jgi:hypothetical protein
LNGYASNYAPSPVKLIPGQQTLVQQTAFQQSPVKQAHTISNTQYKDEDEMDSPYDS